MADRTQPTTCGIDVSKDTLDIACADQSAQCIANTPGAIAQWLTSLPEQSRLGLEATGYYHDVLQDQALAAGHQVYLINGQQLNHYREAVGTRAKTDPGDARLLCRYLEREHADLKPVKSLTVKEKTLWRLLQRRATLVRARSQLRLSLNSEAATRDLSAEATQGLDRVIAKVDRQLRALARELDWDADLARCRSIPGIGELNALALLACFRRGDFQRADQFVAYLGLDVRVRDSGKSRGRRKLSKRGNPEVRRLLYNAAMSASRTTSFGSYYQRHRERGLSTTASGIALARKLVRIAFALLSKGEVFEEKCVLGLA